MARSKSDVRVVLVDDAGQLLRQVGESASGPKGARKILAQSNPQPGQRYAIVRVLSQHEIAERTQTVTEIADVVESAGD